MFQITIYFSYFIKYICNVLKTPMMVEGCRSFVGMVNFLSLFCPELQKLIKSIYDLIEKVDDSYGEKNNS